MCFGRLGPIEEVQVDNSTWRSEALAVDDAGTGLVVLLLRDPHLLERRERREDRAADPHGVLALRRRDDPASASTHGDGVH